MIIKSKAEWGVVFLTAVYFIGCITALIVTGNPAQINPLQFIINVGQLVLLFIVGYALYLIGYAFYVLIKDRPKKAEIHLIQKLKQIHGDKVHLKYSLFLFSCFVVFFSVFTTIKPLIPYINPYQWDGFFTLLDFKLHLGHDPWALLHPVLKWPPVTYLVGAFYTLWFPVLYIAIYWQLFLNKDKQAQLEFFYSFFLIWAVLGTFFAIFYSSAGPAYVQSINNSDYFMPLMKHLYDVNAIYNIYALQTQDYLWQNFKGETLSAGTGISAFPSMHVATTFLIVLTTYNQARHWFKPALFFFIAILIGSVYLGWHYAVDGYFAVLMTYIIWKLVGKFIKHA